MNVKRLSEIGAKEVLEKVLAGIQRQADQNESNKDMLEALIDNFLDPLAADDFFGTEGWEHAFGLDD